MAWGGEASDVQSVGRMQKTRATRIVVKTIMALIYKWIPHASGVSSVDRRRSHGIVPYGTIVANR